MLLDIREQMYKGKEKEGTKPHHRATGKRTQQHFDPVRKVWREIDSSDSDWDDEEWHIFGERSPETTTNKAQLPMTEANLLKLRESLPIIRCHDQYDRYTKQAQLRKTEANLPKLGTSVPTMPDSADDQFTQHNGNCRHSNSTIYIQTSPVSVVRYHHSSPGPPLSYYNRRGETPPGRSSSVSSTKSDRRAGSDRRVGVAEFEEGSKGRGRVRARKAHVASSEAATIERGAERLADLNDQEGALREYLKASNLLIRAMWGPTNVEERRDLARRASQKCILFVLCCPDLF